MRLSNCALVALLLIGVIAACRPATVVPPVPSSNCDGLPDGAEQSRTRFATATVPFGGSCAAETQIRRCVQGTWSAWSGTFTVESCAVSPPASCGAVAHGQLETRSCFDSASVPAGSTCTFVTQVRACADGAWSPDFPACANLTCAVAGYAGCDGTPHGGTETRRCFDAATVPPEQSCTYVEQLRTCANGAWSPDFPACDHLSCAVSGHPSCGEEPHGTVETRDCFAAAAVPFGQTCSASSQSRTCVDGAWSPDWPPCEHLNCTVEPPPLACGSTPSGGTEGRPCYQVAAVPFGQTCPYDWQERTCDDGAWIPDWPACEHLACTMLPPSASYDGDGPDWLGINAMCNIWARDCEATSCDYCSDPGQWDEACEYGRERAFEDCELTLVLAKNLGVSWVRWGLSWAFYTREDLTIAEPQFQLLERVLVAARQRGLKVLLQVTPDAPTGAYPDSRPGGPRKLYFTDDAFTAYADGVIATARPYTTHFELFNEPNLSVEGVDNLRFWIDQDTRSADDPRARWRERMTHYYTLFDARLAAASSRFSDFAPKVLSSGLSHGRFSSPAYLDLRDYCCTEIVGLEPAEQCCGAAPATTCNTFHGFGPGPGSGNGCGTWSDPVADLNTYHAVNVVNDLAAGGTPPLGSSVDILSFHTYYWDPFPRATIADEIQYLRDAPGAAGVPMWLTETGWPTYGGPDSNGVAVLGQAVSKVTSGALEKIFVFTVRRWLDDDQAADPYTFGLFSKDGWRYERPTYLSALWSYARQVPYDQRFTPPPTGAPVLRDLAATASTAGWWVNGYSPPSNAQVYGGPSSHVGPWSGVAEDGSSPGGIRLTVDNANTVVFGDYGGIAVPAAGIPTLRAKVGFGQNVPAGTRVQFEVWVIGGDWVGNEVLFPYDKTRDGALETLELDLSQVRGRTINLVLRALLVGTLAVGSSADVLFATPRIIDRGD